MNKWQYSEKGIQTSKQMQTEFWQVDISKKKLKKKK